MAHPFLLFLWNLLFPVDLLLTLADFLDLVGDLLDDRDVRVEVLSLEEGDDFPPEAVESCPTCKELSSCSFLTSTVPFIEVVILVKLKQNAVFFVLCVPNDNNRLNFREIFKP